MENLIPEDMKEPKWMMPVCILTFTIGIFLLTVLSTELVPEMRGRAASRGLTQFLAAIAILNVASPIAVLYYYCAQQDSSGTPRA
ncbi:hypothetical protein KOM00_07380 [Geomonas sp. Red69]|uniref:hypothetical protein n=1 Tax=Geomonas diazotrophica TaxID=2843197 RepID=UPI001C1022F5|nr:hypothetical protein [Geomonas diazotrophica]MBU5636557.1 hypothetical protein [Geomonas diazotrophica]